MYQQQNTQLRNRPVPSSSHISSTSNGHAVNVPIASSPQSRFFPPNQVQNYQYVSHNRHLVPLETNTVYTNNSYKNQPYHSTAVSTTMQPVENHSNYNVMGNFNNGKAHLESRSNNLSEYSFTANTTTSLQVAQIKPTVPYTLQNLNTMNNPNFNKKNAVQLVEINKSQSESNKSNKSARPIIKRNDNEKIRILTGTAEKVIKWHKIYKDYFCFYEVIASLISIQEGTLRFQKVLLLRDKKGPIIQIIHYVNDHIRIENFFVGNMLRCVGRMVGPNIMHGLSIREATDDEVTTLQRMSFISDHAISKALNSQHF